VILWLLVACGGADVERTAITGSRTSGTMTLDPVRWKLYVANQDRPSVTTVDVATLSVVDEVALPDGAEPRQIAVSADGLLVYASDWALGQVHVLSGGTVRRSEAVGALPYGIVAGPAERPDVMLAAYGWNQGRIFNAVMSEELQAWSFGWGDDSAPIDEDGSVSNGWDPRAIVWDEARNALYVGHQMNGRISKVDLETGEIDAMFLSRVRDDDPAVPQGVVYRVEQMAIAQDGSRLYVPHVLWNPSVPYGGGRQVWPAVSVVDLDAFVEVDRWVPGDGLDATLDGAPQGLASPAAAAVSPDGATVYVVTEGDSRLLTIDVAERRVTSVLALPGDAPRSVVLNPDGTVAFVHLAMDAELAVVDLVGEPVVRSVVALSTLPDPLAERGWREGKRLFHQARSEGVYAPSTDGAVACASCHTDGMTRTIRWFVLDTELDHASDGRFGHADSVVGFSSPDREANLGDLVRMFRNQGGLVAGASPGSVAVEPDTIPSDLRPALESLEAWLHGPTQLPFAGSWASTIDGQPTDPSDWPDDAECARCHAEIYAEFQGSAHANAGTNDPFFSTIEADLIADRGGGFTGWCLGCHAPQSLVSGGTRLDDGPATEPMRRGLQCLSCHGVVDFKTAEGNNSFIYDPVGVLAPGFPEEGEDPTAHALAMQIDPASPKYEGKLALGASGFCGACHQSYTPGIGLTEFLTYQEYLDSPYHGNEHENEQRCADCHMPADKGWADHTFLGPNLWFYRTYGTEEQEAAAVALLQRAATVALTPSISSGGASSVRVTIENVGAGHRFPTGVSNLREVFLEVRFFVDGVERLAVGGVGPDGALTADTPRFQKVLYDADGAHLDMHQVWRIASLEDGTLPPGGRADVVVPAPGFVSGERVDVVATLRMRALPPQLVARAISDVDAVPVVDLVSTAAQVTVP
jgi:YVTN family beta-propeller protein